VQNETLQNQIRMKKFLERGKKLYWWLIGTFAMLYLAVAFVSTLHAITFFQLANTLGLAILLGAAYEIGQAAVLFSILMSQNRNRVLAWGMMFLLTALQVTANVYASFKFMVDPLTGTENWTFWQRAILFGVEADAETYKVIISWISGALLPIVALGMTALVADNIRMAQSDQPLGGDILESAGETPDDDDEPLFKNPFKKKKKEQAEIDPLPPIIEEKPPSGTLTDEKSMELAYKSIHNEINHDKEFPVIDPQIGVSDKREMKMPKQEIDLSQFKSPGITGPEYVKDDGGMKPVNKMNGWNLYGEYVDDEHNVFNKGKYIGKDPTKTPTSKKA